MTYLSGACPAFVERELQLRTLSGIAAEVATGGARLVLITGEAGSGKTRLCAEFVQTLPEGWRSVRVGADRLAPTPAAPFEGLVGGVGLDGDAPHALGGALAEAITMRAEGPLVVTVEDVQWLDPVALAALPHALHELGAAPVLILATFRLGAHAPGTVHMRGVADLLRDPAAAELRLPALTSEGVAEMARAMGVEPDVAERAFERSGGNPFFAEELFRADDPGIPWTVTEAVAQRIADLPRPARRLAGILALAAAPLPWPVIEELAPRADEAVRPLLDAAVATRTPEDAVGLRHALVAEALVALLTTDERRRDAARLAATLEGAGADPERAALLWRTAGDRSRAAAAATAGADRMFERRTYRAAADLYAIALEDPPEDDRAAAELFERAAISSAHAGEMSQASRFAAEAERRFERSGDVFRARGVWLSPAMTYVPKPQVRPADLEEGSTQRSTAELQELMASGAATEAIALAGEILEAYDGTGPIPVLAPDVLHVFGETRRAEEWFVRLIADAERTGDGDALSQLLSARGAAAYARGEVELSIELMREAVVAADRVRSVAGSLHRASLALLLAIRGDLDDAETVVDELRSGDELSKVAALLPEAAIRVDRGDPGGAGARLKEIVPLVATTRYDTATIAILSTVAGFESVTGEHAAVLQTVARAERIDHAALSSTRADRALFAARSAHALGDRDAMEGARAAIAAQARYATGPGLVGAVEAVAGYAARLAGEEREAVERFVAAAGAFERAPKWPDAGDCWCDAAAAALSAGLDATSYLTSAEEIARRRGLDRIAGRVTDLRERAAEEPGLPPALAALTPRELDVIELAALGRTNKEIAAELYLSEGTVRNYLSNAFAKLGLSRRSEAAALLASLR